MFTARFFNLRQFAVRFFPKIGATINLRGYLCLTEAALGDLVAADSGFGSLASANAARGTIASADAILEC